MREPYGSLVEFISSYNCGGDFGRIDSRVLGTPTGTNVRLIKQWTGNMVEVDNDRGFVGKISSRVKPKSSQRPSGSKKTF